MKAFEARPLAGPGPIGHSVGIARGTYMEILSISAPASASPGDRVPVEVRVQSLYASPIYIAVTSRYNGIDLFFSPDYALVNTYAVQTFTASFIMPNNDVRLDVWSFYWLEPEWYQDDYGYIDIAVAAVPESAFRGFGISEYQTA